MSMPKCGKCLLSEFDSEAFVKEIKDYIALIPEEQKAPPELYSHRLEICRNCSSLSDGLCGECGCFAEIRSAKFSQKCPVNKW